MENVVATKSLSTVHKLGNRPFYSGWKPEPPSIKDYRFSTSPMRAEPIPPQSPDRRALGHNGPVMDQGDIGSCVGCSTAYGVAFLRRTDRDNLSTLYSALFQYYEARVADGMQWEKIDAGAYIRDSMDRLRAVGIPPASNWKYNAKLFAKKPTPSVYKAAKAWKLGAHYKIMSLTELLRALASNCAVVGGISVYDSMMTPAVERTGVVPMPRQSEEMLGGHAVYFDHYSQATRLIRFQNSWGEGWGDNGYGYIPFEYFRPDLADDFWAMVNEAPETTPWKD